MHKMTQARRQLFLDGHNERRNILAMGELKRQVKVKREWHATFAREFEVTEDRNGVFTHKTAVDMGEMVSTETHLRLISCNIFFSLKNYIQKMAFHPCLDLG